MRKELRLECQIITVPIQLFEHQESCRCIQTVAIVMSLCYKCRENEDGWEHHRLSVQLQQV